MTILKVINIDLGHVSHQMIKINSYSQQSPSVLSLPSLSHFCWHLSVMGGTVVEWFRVLDLKSEGPWFKSSTLLLSGFVLGSPKFNSSTTLCR